MTHAPNSGEIELRIVEEEEGDQEKASSSLVAPLLFAATVSPGRNSVRVQLPIDSPSASVESDSSSGSGVVEPSTPISDNCPSTSTSSEESSATPTATYVKEEDSSNNRYKYHKQQSYSNRRSSSVSTPSIYSSPATRTSDLWPRISLCLRTSARKIECIPVIGSLTRWCLYRRQRRYSHSGASTASNATPQRRHGNGQALNAPSSVGGGIRSSPRSVHMLNPSPSSSTSRSGCDKFTILSILFVCLLFYTLFPDFLANSLPALNQLRKGADGGGLNTVYLQERAAGLTHSIVDSLKISHDHDNYQDTNSNNNNNNGGNNSSNENNIPLIHTNPSVVDDSSSNMKATNDASPKTVAEDVPTPKSVVVDSPTPVMIAETPAVTNEASAVADGSEVETAAADGDTDSYTPITEAKEEWMVEHIPMIPPDAEFPADSTAETLMLKPKDDKDMSHAYHICTFTNVCLSPDGVQFRFQNHNSWLEMSEMAKKCENQEFYWASKLCRCFHYAFKPLVLPYEFYTDVTQSLAKVRAADKARGDGKNSLDRRYPDPFLHVTEARHEHYWSIHKWVPHHHIAHWAQKLMIMQSIFQHQEAFTDILPPISGLAFHDTSNTHPPLEDHLLNIFNFSVEASFARRRPSTSSDGTGRRSREWAHPLVWNSNDPIKEMNHLLDPDNGRTIWYEDLVSHRYSTSLKLDECKNNPQRCSLPNPAYEKALNELKPDQLKKLEDGTVEPLLPLQSSDGHDIPSRIPNPQLHTCFNRVSMSPIYGLLSLDRRDSDMFRSVTAKRMGLSTRSNRCPPRRAILLTRLDRKILNVDELLAFMKQTYRLDVELHEITGKNSSAEQIHLFATTGLILSSHSSQMINVMFSHPGQSLVEITPEWYNIDFGAYAHALGLNFNYALGGHIPKSHSEDSRQSPDYTYVSDPNMLECTQSLQSECPSGDSWCFKRHNQRLCSKVNQWPNKQMNFYANMTAVKLAVHQSMSHIQDQCFGKW